MICCPVPTLIPEHVPPRPIPVLTSEHADEWASCLGQPGALGNLCPNPPAGEWHLGEGTGLHTRGLSTAVPCADPHTEPGEGWERRTRGPGSHPGVEHNCSPQPEVPVPSVAPAGHHLQRDSVPRQRRATCALQKHLFDPPTLLSG